ncbi:MAG TPA: EAL domain-containing protein [Gemmatimonadales bacterium]|nr:EAL domain-containing protein [Gemmatimonadales bacterium]
MQRFAASADSFAPVAPPSSPAEEALRVSEERLKLALLATDTRLWEWHAETGARFVGDGWTTLLGDQAEALDGGAHLPTRFIHPDDLPAVAHRLEQHLAGVAPLFDAEYRLRTQRGEWRWVHDRGRVVERDDGGKPMRLIGMQTDVTERKETDAALFRERERALVTLASIADAVITTDSRGIVDYLNPVAEYLTGWSLAEARGEPLTRVFTVLHDTTREPVETSAERVLDEARPMGLTSHLTLVRRDGVEFAVDESAAPLRARDGGLTGVAVVFRDATPQRQITRQLSHQATHDPLTGLVNRRELERRLARVVASAEEAGTTHGLCYLDLDRFKAVNDSCGHAAGDALLRQLAGILRSELRGRDTLARLGGDEFAVLLEHCELDQARRIADALRLAVQNFRFAWDDATFSLGVSIGLVEITAATGTEADVLRAADAACYRAKYAGRNRVHVARTEEQAAPAAPARMDWAARITRALEHSQFRLYVQPIVPLVVNGEAARRNVPASGFWEVFLRLEDDEGVMLPAGAFLPAAERYDLMTMIDRWVVRETITRLAGWRPPSAGATLPLCCINLGAGSLRDDALLGVIEEELTAHRLPPSSLCFEINESAVLADLGQAVAFCRGLRALGCRVALDDFGGGLASLHHLKALPLDLLKLSAALTRGLEADPLQGVVARAASQAAAVLGLPTVATGADSAGVVAALKALGLDYAQGFALGRPRPIEELMVQAERAPA